MAASYLEHRCGAPSARPASSPAARRVRRAFRRRARRAGAGGEARARLPRQPRRELGLPQRGQAAGAPGTGLRRCSSSGSGSAGARSTRPTAWRVRRSGCRPAAGSSRSGLQLRMLPGMVVTRARSCPSFVRFFNFIEAQASARAALVPERPGRRSGPAGPRLRLPPAAARAAPLRRGASSRLPRDRHRAQRRALPAPRLQGHPGVAASRRRAAVLADVARPGLGRVHSTTMRPRMLSLARWIVQTYL